MNECLGQSSCCSSFAVYLFTYMVKSNESDNVGFIKRTKRFYKGVVWSR